MEKKIRKRKAHVDRKYCVACGVCVKNCNLGAVYVYKGIYAEVDSMWCVGCGRCELACPSSAIKVLKIGDN